MKEKKKLITEQKLEFFFNYLYVSTFTRGYHTQAVQYKKLGPQHTLGTISFIYGAHVVINGQ